MNSSIIIAAVSLTALALAAMLAPAPIHAAAPAKRFPITVSRNGMTATVNDARWMRDASGLKGLLVHYSVSGSATTPFTIAAANTRPDFIGPDGGRLSYQRLAGGVFNASISPLWKSVKLDLRAADKKASAEAAYGDFNQRLTWNNVALPTAPNTPVTVGAAITTAHGTTVTLTQITLRRPASQPAAHDRLALVFRVVPSANISDMHAEAAAGIAVSTADGHSIVNARLSYGPGRIDSLPGSGIEETFNFPIPASDENAKGLSISVDVHESAPSLADPRAYRDLAVAIPLAGLPGASADRPDRPLDRERVGSLTATIDSITHEPGQPWAVQFWLKRPVGAPDYQIDWCSISTDTGVSLDSPYGQYINPGHTLWKADGAAPSPGETSAVGLFRLPHGFPAGAKSLTIAATASDQVKISRLFDFKDIDLVGPGVTMPVSITAPEESESSTAAAPAGRTPIKMTITEIRCAPVRNRASSTPSQYRLWVYYRIESVGPTVLLRVASPKSVTDDLGRSVDPGPPSSNTDVVGGSAYFETDLPQPGAKAVNITVDVDDTVQSAPPVTFTFKGVPIPADSAKPS